MITTSKLNNGIVFTRAIFWGPRVEGRGPRVNEHKHPNKNHILELIKRRSKVNEKNMSRECALNFHQR